MKAILVLQPILLLLLFQWRAVTRRSTKVIKTKSGLIRGTVVFPNGNKVYQYLGIPFATPPLGELRFQKPLPVVPWATILEADRMAPACIQYMYYKIYRSPWYPHKLIKSEDCLYLNIWVPESDCGDECIVKKSVMIWFYGGFFAVGSNGIKLYNGKVLASEGDVIVVVPNYRVATMGLFTTNTAAAPGSLPLYDMLLAIKWVKKNIAAFGGDPNQLTLVGQSAGAIGIGSLCVSPLAKGLFKRVIMESASPAYLQADDPLKNIGISQSIAETFGCANITTTIFNNPNAVVECMKQVNAFEIGVDYFIKSTQQFQTMLPSWGNSIMPKDARTQIIAGKIHDVDVLIGSNQNEGAYLISSSNPELFGYRGEKRFKHNPFEKEIVMIRSLGGPVPAIAHIVAEALRYDNMTLEELYTLAGDIGLTCPTEFFAEGCRKAGRNVYYYYFTHRAKKTSWAKWEGVTHGAEVPFVFGKPLINRFHYTRRERNLSRRMIKIWSDFAKYGKPGDGFWPMYSRETPIYFDLDIQKPFSKKELNLNYGFGPHIVGCEFLRPFFGFEYI